MMIAYIDGYKDRFGVEPICRTLNGYLEGGFITARGYRAAKRRLPSVRSMRDKVLVAEIKRIHTENYCAYGNGKCGMPWFDPVGVLAVTKPPD